ncbi:hypothetical protein GCM10007049_21060 [Echinicola pacifica]|uniref:DUF2264 domain-containing protein n=1 Tax=Echinicola pacifica TaxID=346377 RepID=A0A918PYV3_9BACT|nr:DUF2264 domain-containing protein [Echinicola pacifica]GGZ27956.1 hypothetical protein GCM10007049_21060 [Echinicola pacifica]
MNRRSFVKFIPAMGAIGSLVPHTLRAEESSSKALRSDQREYWANTLYKIAYPVLTAMSEEKLISTMPVETPSDPYGGRKDVTHLEALGRTLAGLAPWLNLPEQDTKEGEMRKELAEKARLSIAAGVNPDSPDYLNWTKGAQPLVDGAFLVHGIMRAPEALWAPLPDKVKQQFIQEIKNQKEAIPPYYNNWLLFGAMLDAFLFFAGDQGDFMRIDFAVKKHDEWYVGDGWYGDGKDFHMDYYNGYVIQPMMQQILKIAAEKRKSYQELYEKVQKRMIRFAEQQERLISPEGTYPPIGRSITYRVGAFQPLAEVALQDSLPEHVSRGQVRAALGAIINRQFEAPGTYDENGWLQIGFCGHQPEMGDRYISTGSLYLCTLGFLPLGLPETHAFWTNEAEDWTAKKAWAGVTVPADHAISF